MRIRTNSTRKKKRKRRPGSPMPVSLPSSPVSRARGHLVGDHGRRAWLRAIPMLTVGAFLLAAAFSLLDARIASAKDKKAGKGEPPPVTDTLIKVTTFTELGSTLRGATVKLLPADKDGNARKGKTLQGVTNGMGEYPFHVPKTEAKYVLQAEAKGFESVSKVVHAQGEDQTDIFLQLPAKK